MPTKRKRLSRRRRDRDRPEWARRLLEDGVEPPTFSEANAEYIGWLFFGDDVPGLPDPSEVKLPPVGVPTPEAWRRERAD